MPALTFVYAIVAIACVAGVIRMLSQPSSERSGRGWLVALLLALACVTLVLGARNAYIVHRTAQVKRHVERGRELMQKGQVQEAEAELERATQIDPKNEEAKQELERLRKARREAEQRAAQGTGDVVPGGGPGGAATGPAAGKGHPQRRESQVNITRYALDVELFPDEHKIKGEATFGVRAKKGRLKSLEIGLSPQCEIETITVGGQPAKTKRDEDWVEVTPRERVGAREDTEVTIRYEGFGKERILPGGDVLSPEGSYLRPESRWCPAIGFLEFRAPVRVSITVPKGQFALGPGVLKSETKAESGRVTYEWECRQNAMGVCIAAGPWERLDGKAGDLPVTVLLWKKHAEHAEKLLADAKQVVAYFTSLYGDFPYDKLAIAEIPFFPGGYSPTSMVLLGELIFDEKKELIQKVVAHEIAHQWWGNLVLPQGPGAGWLAEGFAEYSSILYVGNANGEEAFRRALWDAKQQYHILMHNPPEEPIIETDPFDQQGSYIGVVYSKGAYVLHMLRYVVGEEAFFATLRGFVEAHPHGIGTIADFREEAEKHSDQKLAWFFEQWLERTGTIELTYDWSTTSLGDGRYETTIVLDQQTDKPYRMPIDLRLVTSQGKPMSTEELTDLHNEYRFATRAEPRDIDIDPHDNLLLAVPKRATPTS